ncbi:TolC family protein [Hydrotalea sp.]|uniref:TolC family protein n=1 Tax=Hydrotalea sp. TaxID=2881279 RepID=UPI00258CE6A5|nr:TolC family protein [Hydrotalea sp.]
MKKFLFILLMEMLSAQSFSQVFSLQQCIDSAIQNNYTVRIAAYDIKQTDAKVEEAKSNLLPKINTVIDYRYYINLPYQLLPAGVFGGPAGTYKEAQFGVPNNINANVQLSYPLYNPALKATISTIETGTEIAVLQKIKSQEDIVMEVSNVYYNAQVLLSQLSFTDSNIVNSKNLLSIMQLLYQQKMATGTDVQKINLQLAQLQTQKETVESQYQQVINILKFLIGFPPEKNINIMPHTHSNTNSHQKDDALTEVKLAEKQINFLQSEKNTLQKSKLPIINLNGFYGTTGFANTGANDFIKFYPLGYAGVQAILPLYTGNSVKKKIKGKEIEIEKANTKLAMIKDKNEVDKENNVYQLNIAKRNLVTIQQQINLAQNIYTNTLLQKKEGIATLTDVLQADNAVREAQKNYIDALIAISRAELENKKLTGNLLNK